VKRHVTLGGRQGRVRLPPRRRRPKAGQRRVRAVESIARSAPAARPLHSGLDLAALMLYGVHFADGCSVVALPTGADGTKVLVGRVAASLTNTNCIESMISIAHDTTRNVKRWRDGKMIKR
jgi:hypothetical protein